MEPETPFNVYSEGVADYTKRPLYTVSCGELGTDCSNVERNLKTALDLATTWNAIILIDEADIFLEARGPNDLKRNGLVSSKCLTPYSEDTNSQPPSILALAGILPRDTYSDYKSRERVRSRHQITDPPCHKIPSSTHEVPT